MSEQGLSVVIPTHNRGAQIERCLLECTRLAGGVDLEFVVIDDGSTDDTSARLERLSASLPKLIWRSVSNEGPGAARNLGASLATRDVLLFMGDDITPANENFFTVHSEMHARMPEVEVAILGKSTWPTQPAYDVSFVMSVVQGRSGEQFAYADLTPYSFLDYRFFYTSNVSMKRGAVRDWLSEGFSSAFAAAAYEDVELAYRLHKDLGLRILYAPAALARHDHRYTVADFIERQVSAGMMAHTFVRLHPEIATRLTVDGIARDLRKAASTDDAALVAEYLAVVEGIKSWARLLERHFNLGAEYWHADLLHAVFALCHGHGFILAWDEPRPNLAAAYRSLLVSFSTQMQRAIHHEATGHVLDDSLFAPWKRGRRLAPWRRDALRNWAQGRPLLVRLYRFLAQRFSWFPR